MTMIKLNCELTNRRAAGEKGWSPSSLDHTFVQQTVGQTLARLELPYPPLRS